MPLNAPDEGMQTQRKAVANRHAVFSIRAKAVQTVIARIRSRDQDDLSVFGDATGINPVSQSLYWQIAKSN
jgi:hypothetical protein